MSNDSIGEPVLAATDSTGGSISEKAEPHPFDGTTLRDISREQWNSGLAAWLGWMFDGLDMHIYILVATPFVAELLGGLKTTDPQVTWYSSIIQAMFMLGWAMGGGFFGYIADRLGRSRTLSLTVLTYAAFTGLSYFATTWWHLMIFRFLAALGIGGEWAVGASLLSETWPRKWRPWMAAILQSGVNIGILLAGFANFFLAKSPPRYLFLVGILPAILVLWIRRAVPEPEEWHTAKANASDQTPGIMELFRGDVRRISLWVIAVCGLSLSGHWAFTFWFAQHLRNLPEVLDMSAEERNKLISMAYNLVMFSSIAGNFLCGGISKLIGYRATISWTCLVYFGVAFWVYRVERDHVSIMTWLPLIGLCHGMFALFTMYLPPLFPTLLRTTGAGFCYNIGRIASAIGIVAFGMMSATADHRVDHRFALMYSCFLFIPAAILAWRLPYAKD